MPKFKPPAATKGQRIAAPSTAYSVDHNQLPPAFCFRHLVAGYGIQDCTNDEKCSLLDTLWQLAQRRWIDLTLAGKHGSGCEKIHQLKVAIPAHITEDVTFLAFRFYTKHPMVGYRDGRIFQVVWIDRKHEIY